MFKLRARVEVGGCGMTRKQKESRSECIKRMISNGTIRDGGECESCPFYVQKGAYGHDSNGTLMYASYCQLGLWRVS